MYADPDLYNPLWIDMTLAFTLSVIGNIAKLMKYTEETSFDYSLVIKAFSTVFFLALFVSLFFIIFFNCFAGKLTFV